MTVDLSTSYLGLDLASPFVISACPLTRDSKKLGELADSGASAAVLPSIFEDQIEQQRSQTDAAYFCHARVPTESLSYFQAMDSYNSGVRDYLALIERIRGAVRIPIIASLNATRPGSWTAAARSMQNVGADALELNVYYVPTDPRQTSRDVENRYLTLLGEVVSEVSIPVALKIGPFFTSLPHFVSEVQRIGGAGVVLFNRYLEPEIDIETQSVWPRLDLSHPHELRLALRWLAVLRNQTTLSLAATGGVHSMADVVKSLLAGADVVMMASVLLQRGAAHLRKMSEELTSWLESHEFASLESLRGALAYAAGSDSSRFERGNYLRALVSGATHWKIRQNSDLQSPV